MISISPITDKKVWETFLLAQERQPFFQSWDWGELNKCLNNKILRVGIYNKKELLGICLIVEVQAKKGRFLHLRHGPILKNFKKEYFQPFLKYVTQEGYKRSAVFIRMSPLLKRKDKIEKMFKNVGFRNSPIHNMDAEICWVLDLNKSEDELLKEMRKTTRYLVRRGETIGLRAIKAKNTSEVKSFLRLYNKTVQKHSFVPHQGIEQEFALFSEAVCAELFFITYKKRIISGALVIFYGDQAVYHHGASDPKYERLSPSYLLQWEAIKEAKRRGKKLYNFWGIAPDGKPNHPWAGLTLFKKGFGGYIESFLHSQDLPLTSKYWLTWILETYRRITKGY